MNESCNGLKVGQYYIQENGIIRDEASGTFLTRLEELFTEIEHLRVQLAGCGVAAMQNTEESIKERAKDGDYGYSASYSDVCKAVDREIRYRNALLAIVKHHDMLAGPGMVAFSTVSNIARKALEI